VRLIGEHVALKRQGREHIGLCPFHDDHSPSLRVVTHKGTPFYVCFSCGASGDCIRFAHDFLRMSYGEALRFLADRAGIRLEPRTLDPRRAEEIAESEAMQKAMLKAVAWAQDFFRQTLCDEAAGALARETIARRGLRAETVEKFGLGAAPEGYETMTRRLEPRGLQTLRTAVASGLLRQRAEGNGWYDTFRNRLTFPIHDEVGRPIAFGARALRDEDTPKYLNSPESDLFRKSQTLYALHLARPAIIRAGQAIVTEGYVDAIACHQAGFENTVATLGTAFTREHAAVLRRMCPSVVLVFDGDEAGFKAAERAIEVLFTEPVDIRICVLPGGQDPDDLLRDAGGPDVFRDLLARATDALQFRFSRFRGKLAEAQGLSSRQRLIEEFLGEIVRYGYHRMDGVRRDLMLAPLAAVVGLPEATVASTLDRLNRSTTAQASGNPRPTGIDMEGASIDRARLWAEREIVRWLAWDPTLLPLVADQCSAAHFQEPTLREIVSLIFSLQQANDHPSLDLGSLIGALPDDRCRTEAARLADEAERACDGQLEIARRKLAQAVTDFHLWLQRAGHQRRAEEARTALQADPDRSTEIALEQILKRKAQPHMPAAIGRTVRDR